MMFDADSSLYHEQVRKKTNWTGMAFLVEAMVLLLLLAASLAVIMSLFAAAYTEGEESENLSEGIILATDLAEEFCVDPQGVLEQGQFTEGDFVLLITADSTKQPNGTLYNATITVRHIVKNSSELEDVYTLNTARYVSGVA